MRFSSRSKMSILLSLVTIVAIISAFMVTAVFRGQASHAASAGSMPMKGTATKATAADMSKLPKGTGTASIQPHQASFNVNRHQSSGQASIRGGEPNAHATSLSNSNIGKLQENFNGASSHDSASVNGFDLEPPDQGLCVGGGFVIELVNLTLRVYDRNGTVVTGPFALNPIFGESSSEFLSDPRCYFDPSTKTFFLTILAIDSNGKHSHTDVGVLPLSTGIATTYHFDTTDAGNVAGGCPCFGDQPLLGIDAFNIYVSSNEFSINKPNFDGAEVYAISKSQLAAEASTVNFVVFPHLSDGGALIETLQPAITNSPSDAEYLMHSFTVDASGNNNAIDHRLGIFAITNQEAVAAGGIPTLSSPTIITSESYAQPNLAANPNGNVLNADDDRLQQLQFINGVLWSALDTAVIIHGDATRDGAAWFEVHPSLSGLHVNATILDQGYLAVAGAYLLYPAITQSKDRTVGMVFSITSSTINPSAAYAIRPAAAHASFGSIHVAASGNGPDTGFTCGGPSSPCRWGDYSAAVLSGTNIWMATEYIPPVSSQSTFAKWGTRVFELTA